MSKLSDLRSKSEIVTLSNDLRLEINPMSLADEAEIGIMLENKESSKAIVYLVKEAIKRAIPDATDDEIDNLNKDDLKLVSEAVLKINKLVGDEPKKLDTN